MGVVYKARQRGLNRVVALKMLLDPGDAEEEERSRLRREARALAELRHPQIVQIYELGEHQGHPFLALEYVEGGNLAEKKGEGPWPAEQAARLLLSLARTVHAAHQAGVVHRDLKPANHLLATDGTPKLTDFGLARRLDGEGGHTRSGAILGTPGYLAPEQAEGKKRLVGPATDV
jgi:serine/threonine protein kinase